ncbi:MAG: 30S ribosomal protein S18 [Candidatus Brocadiia bacterium]|jgi:small subunit ribosomal protein S18
MQKKSPKFRDRTKCRFCRLGMGTIDYKDVQTLTKLTTNRGRLFSRKRSGNCARHQRSARVAIKRSRFIGLMPFVG